MEPGRACPAARRLAADDQRGRDRQIRSQPATGSAHGEAVRCRRAGVVRRPLGTGRGMIEMANDKPMPTSRNFAAWGAVGAIFYILAVWVATAALHQDVMDAILRPTK